jgi:hypothetical protein
MTTLTPEQIEFALKDLAYAKVCDEEKEHWTEMIDTAIIALETCREYAEIIKMANQLTEEVERRIIGGDPSGGEPIGLFAGGGGR